MTDDDLITEAIKEKAARWVLFTFLLEDETCPQDVREYIEPLHAKLDIEIKTTVKVLAGYDKVIKSLIEAPSNKRIAILKKEVGL
jgi:hypothetical protein